MCVAVFPLSGAITAMKGTLLTNPFGKNNNFKPVVVRSEKQNRTSQFAYRECNGCLQLYLGSFSGDSHRKKKQKLHMETWV